MSASKMLFALIALISLFFYANLSTVTTKDYIDIFAKTPNFDLANIHGITSRLAILTSLYSVVVLIFNLCRYYEEVQTLKRCIAQQNTPRKKELRVERARYYRRLLHFADQFRELYLGRIEVIPEIQIQEFLYTLAIYNSICDILES